MSRDPGRIHLVSASAGSGKTHRLVNELEGAITLPDAHVRPEGVIATTFTKKAAAELRERVRSRLLEAGHVDEAQRLGAARIGTVNSICGRLVSDFAFDLGISPEVQVLDERASDEAFGRALSAVVSVRRDDEDGVVLGASGPAAVLTELGERWPGLDWEWDVRTIASRARANGMDAEDIRACAARSAEALLRYFPPAAADGEALERALERALGKFLAGPLDPTKKTEDVVQQARHAHSRLRSGRPLSWWEWSRLPDADIAVKSRGVYAPVCAAARAHERHPLLREDLRRCIDSVFELAARVIESYEAYKREWGLMDFVDQEVLALQLLERPDVCEMLREQVDLVLVDEFQDTSPLQLQVFLALARLAPRSLWVGDQKQSIFGFRGTDPALMDAAIEGIVRRSGSEAYESLPYSWRSRAELVRMTSDVFAPAFEVQGIPAERVRLEPAAEIAARPDAMGPVVETWLLQAKNKENDGAALARAVRELVDDETVRVRDVITDEERGSSWGDVAILCRSNDSCAAVTSALQAVGIPAVRARGGLMKTAEARLALAALRLWVHPRQPLAAAEIGRLLVHPDAPDKWLDTVIHAPGQAYTTAPEVLRLEHARDALPLAGPVAAFDAAIDAIGLRETCLRWGRSPQRLANLDALRAVVHRYVAACESKGAAATVAGLAAHLDSLEKEEDEQATPTREDAVTVGTLHSAKGLEWPITVLHAIDSGHEPTAFGVHLVSDRATFDFSQPLGGRWIRYWPDPCAGPRQRGGRKADGKTELRERVREGCEHAAAAQGDSREALRLLYVGWTRARDRVVLTGRPGKVIGASLRLLHDGSGRPVISEPAAASPEAVCTWGGRKVTVRVRSVAPAEPAPRAPEPGFGYDAVGPKEFAPATCDMSGISAKGTLGQAQALGLPPYVQPPVEWVSLGTAIHAFFASDRPGLEPSERLQLAAGILESWRVQGALRADALVAASDAFTAWAAGRWPRTTWHREWPVRHLQEDGTELVGYADLVLRDDDSFVVVDHKCLGGTRDDALARCADYAGQLGAYAEVIAAATGLRPAGCFVHLVTQAMVVELEL